MSKYDDLKEKHTAGEDLFKYPMYSEFFNDYNNLILDNVRQNNINDVISLCEQLYRNDATPYYNNMLEMALTESDFSTFIVVFTMWSFCYEKRKYSMTYLRANELLMSASTSNLSTVNKINAQNVDEKKMLLYLVNKIIDHENILYHGDSMVSKDQVREILELCKKYIRDMNLNLPSWITKSL